MARAKLKDGRGQNPNSRANLIPGFHGVRQYQNAPISTKLPDALAERFLRAKGALSNAEALRQAVAFALEQGWRYAKPEEET